MVSLSHRVIEIIAHHGGVRAASRVLEVDAGYLSRLANGSKSRPGKPLLKKLGLCEVIGYENLKPGE